MKTIILDSGPLGMIVNPKAKSETTKACQDWFERMLRGGAMIYIPEIVDYEVRRELIRCRKIQSLQKLYAVQQLIEHIPITTEAIVRAAELWAEVRRSGQPTADSKALDGDVILAAQVLTRFPLSDHPIVATTNVAHIERFIPAQLWETVD